MYGWHIKGRWTGGGETQEETFVLLTTTREPEEIHCRAMQELVSRPFRPYPGLTGKVSVELVEEPVELAPIVSAFA